MKKEDLKQLYREALDKNEYDEESQRYSSAELIGSGAAKEVYRVSDQDTGRDVALAKLKIEATELHDHFIREARLTAWLEHPNIMPVYDVIDENPPWFTMKLVRGSSLHKFISGQNPPLRKLLEIFIKICDAVAYAHDQGVLHLDLKPDNIQVGDFGEVLVCDWGLSQILFSECNERLAVNEAFSAGEGTQHGTIKGSPGFLAPEQAAAQAGNKNVQTDIYSLGAILYFMFCGKAPIESDTLENIIRRTVAGDITAPSKLGVGQCVPPGLEAVCLKALHKEQAQRYSSVKDLAGEIVQYLDGFPTTAEEASFTRQLSLLLRRHAKMAMLIFLSLSLVALLSLSFLFILKGKESEATALAAKYLKERDLKIYYAKEAAPKFYNLAGEVLKQEQNMNLTLEHLKSALALDDKYTDALIFQGDILMSLQRFTEAAASYDKAKAPKQAALCRELQKKIPAGRKFLDPTQIKELERKYVAGTPLYRPYQYLMHNTLYRDLAIAERLEFIKKFVHFSFDFDPQRSLLKMRKKNVSLNHMFQNFPCRKADFSGSSVSSIRWVATMPNLRWLRVDDTRVNSVQALKGLTLEYLSLRNCPVRDINPLAECTISTLDLRGTGLRDLAPLLKIEGLVQVLISPGDFPQAQLEALRKRCDVVVGK